MKEGSVEGRRKNRSNRINRLGYFIDRFQRFVVYCLANNLSTTMSLRTKERSRGIIATLPMKRRKKKGGGGGGKKGREKEKRIKSKDR